MKVSPLNIKKQEFNRKFKGYDIEEVHAYLDRIADEFEQIQRENENLKNELDEANEKVGEFNKIEKSLQGTLLKAQESSSKAIESTRKQTNLMVKEAEIKATQILDKARENADSIRDALINLREERDLIIARLKAIINSQAQLLELKVETAGEEEEIKNKPIEKSKKLDINVDDIVNKLL
jgi:cell division initiation protein